MNSQTFFNMRRRWILLLVLSVPFSLQPALAQQLGQGTDAADLTAWRFMGAAIFVAVLAAAAWLMIRRRGGNLPIFQNIEARRVKILEVSRLSPQAQLCLLHFDGEEYLIAFTAQAATVIATKSVDKGGSD